jgi:hypothetical protein
MNENPSNKAEAFLEELRTTRVSVEELYLVLDHLDHDREEIRDLLQLNGAEGEVVCCARCDADASRLSEAIGSGWTNLQHDPTDGWDYLGICPDCLREEMEREKREQKAFF